MVRASRGFEVVMLVITMILMIIIGGVGGDLLFDFFSARRHDDPTAGVSITVDEGSHRDDRCPPPSETPRHTYSGRLDEFVFAPKTEQIKAILGECVYNKLYKGANNSKIKGGK